MLVQLGWFALGALLVTLGADSFAQGAAGLALARRVSPFGAGLGLLALGGVLPELGVGAAAVALGHEALAFGVLLGSGLAALGVVIGVTALQRPLRQAFRAVWIGAAWLAAAGAALYWLGQDGTLGRGDGTVLLCGFIAWLVFLRLSTRRESPAVRERVASIAATRSELWRGLSRLALGLLALGFGSQYLVDAALLLSNLTGVGEMVFGLGAIALVLALPKLAAASFANHRGLGDMALAATLGGSVADVWALIGVLAWVRPTAVTAAVARGGFPALTAMALVLALALWRRREVGRVSGGILAAGYAALLGWCAWGPR